MPIKPNKALNGSKNNVLKFLKLKYVMKYEDLATEGKLTLAIMPGDYPNTVVTDEVKIEINNLITTKYKARLDSKSSIGLVLLTKGTTGLECWVCRWRMMMMEVQNCALGTKNCTTLCTALEFDFECIALSTLH